LDKYSVVFKWKTSNRELILDALQEVVTTLCIENPEAVRKWGDLSDWHHAIGTGPFILKEFIPDVEATLVKIRIIGDTMNVTRKTNSRT